MELSILDISKINLIKMKPKFRFYFLWLSLICITVFAFQNMPGIPGFTETFVLNQKALSSFQIWRFITAIFLHGGIIHLAYNLFALLLFGLILEKMIGSKKFLIVFLISGILANIIGVNFYTSSLGASGAIYGILGCIAILNPMMTVFAFGMLMPMFVAAILWITADLLRVFGLFDPGNIGSMAHLSGIAIGIFLAFFLRKNIKKARKQDKINIPETYVNAWEDNYVK